MPRTVRLSIDDPRPTTAMVGPGGGGDWIGTPAAISRAAAVAAVRDWRGVKRKMH